MAEKLSYGERNVGLRFNPSGDDEVTASKKAFAAELDKVDTVDRVDDIHDELIADAKSLIRAAQMAVVKVLTWKPEDTDASA